MPIFIPGEKVGELEDLRGFRPLPSFWTVDWSFFLDGAPGKAKKPQHSRRIDARLARGLFDLPGFPQKESSLAFRNLKRGEALGLPSGQDVAQLVGAKPLSGKKLGAPEPTPLWFYVLKESGLNGGQRLGPVGGEIVAEVLLGLLKEDNHSFVNQNARVQTELRGQSREIHPCGPGEVRAQLILVAWSGSGREGGPDSFRPEWRPRMTNSRDASFSQLRQGAGRHPAGDDRSRVRRKRRRLGADLDRAERG